MRRGLAAAIAAVVAHVSPVAAAPARSPTELSALVDVYWGVNANRPADGASFVPGTGTTALRDREVVLNQGIVSVDRDARPVGGHLSVGFGTGFAVLHADQPRERGVGPEVWRHVLRASVVAELPLLRGIEIEAGILPGHSGFESFIARDNWTYTRGWMAEWAPYVQAGLRIATPLSESVDAALHLLDGWGTIGPGGGAVGTGLAWKARRFRLRQNTFAGPQPQHRGRWRLFANTIVELLPDEPIAFALAVDVGWQARAGAAWADWQAVGLHGRWTLNETIAFAARGEWFRDPSAIVAPSGQTLAGITAALEVRPLEALVLKLDLRHDRSTAAVFTARHRAPVRSQWLVVLGAVVSL